MLTVRMARTTGNLIVEDKFRKNRAVITLKGQILFISGLAESAVRWAVKDYVDKYPRPIGCKHTSVQCYV